VSEAEVGYWKKNVAILGNATAEDYALGEEIQAGLASGANRELCFGRYEHSLGYFHENVDRALGLGAST
jgi:hypothetical protein